MKKSQGKVMAEFKDFVDNPGIIPAIPGSSPGQNDMAALLDNALSPLLQALPEADAPDDLFSSIEAELDSKPTENIQTQRADEGEWVQSSDKIWKKVLSEDPETGRGMYLFRCLPGGVLAAHTHERAEHIFVIEGDFWCEGKLYKAGDSQMSVAGTLHHESTIPNGCLFLVYK